MIRLILALVVFGLLLSVILKQQKQYDEVVTETESVQEDLPGGSSGTNGPYQRQLDKARSVEDTLNEAARQRFEEH